MEKADLTLGLATACSSSSFQEKSGFFKKECRSACGMNDMFVLHKALEEERRKIEVFKHELPLCVHLLDKAIEASRGPHCRYVTSSCPRSSIKNSINFDIEWHQRQDDERKPAQPVKLGLHNLSIQPLRKPAGGRSCSEENNASSQECPKVNNYIIQRKRRRSWSPELHQSFLKALHHLGGSQVATPKQIRELMNVEGLTNDEVKSHLQKFRLHVRKPHIQQGSEQGSDHVVVFGSVWLPNQSSIFSKRG